MTIYKINNQPTFNKPIYILGSFESFHKGHNELLQTAKALKENEPSREIVLVYFEDVEYLPKNHGKIFTNNEYRIQQFANLGFKNCIRLFYREIRNWSPAEFIENLVKNQTDYTFIAGTDFKFGAKASGDVKWLLTNYGTNVLIVEPLKLANGNKLSTSFLKECLIAGEIELVNNLNTFNYGFLGELSYSTESVKFEIADAEKIESLTNGIYICNVIVNDYVYYAAASIVDKSITLEFIDYILNQGEYQKVEIQLLQLVRPFLNNETPKINEKDLFIGKNYFVKISKN
ncbi:FAD synthase [Mycoplasmopsis iners]|uniref:FAD synthase n=1 Tax=Mycoplasmopsis iners TaxID=76630 RepID=UPI0004960623|nr:hypothetical protein [Mycoplasmopsis iners]